MVPPNNLGLDLSGKPVNETLYRGMIGSLMYLIASQPDIYFSICLCARYQANPKESHLIVVKRIFRYLKGTPCFGLWYLKCSGFDLKGYSNSDYAGCNMDRKSTAGAYQMLGGKLVCWSAKKQQLVLCPLLRLSLEYNNENYVAHPSTKEVKAELARIATHEALVQKTPLLKASFPVTWRILLTFVIQVLGGNHSSTELLNVS
ncbi:hypothetical protein Tco_1317960 [Tanacetum coccineum]